MADDPTVQISLRRTRECPTCGHSSHLSEVECSLCGATLPRDLPLPVLSSGAPDATMVGSTLPPPSDTEEATLKDMPPSSPPPAPHPTPVQEATGNAAQPVPFPPPSPTRLIAVSPTPEPPPRSPTVQPSVSSPSTQPKSSPLTRWGGLAVGALALFLAGFFAAKMLSSSKRDQKIESSSLRSTAIRAGEKATIDDKKEEKVVLSVTPPVTPVVQLIGQVTTADQLFPIRVFGADSNDVSRGVEALRTQVEKGLQGVREVYNADIATHPRSLGTVILELSVLPEGRVTNAAAHVTGSVSRDLQHAIVNAVKDWKFSPTQGEEVKVFYPLLLSPEKIDPATYISHFKELWPGRYKVLAAAPVPVRAEASDSAQEVGTIGPGLFLSVVSSQGGWLGALSPKGKVGYVRLDAISPRVESPPATEAKG